MRWILLLALVMTYTVTPARAQQSPQVGLYIDDMRSGHCASGTDYYPVDVYMWARPGEYGMQSVMFRVLLPDIVIPAYLDLNVEEVLTISGTPQNGIQVIFNSCKEDWVWGFRQTVLLTSEEPGIIQVYPDDKYEYQDVLGFNTLNCFESGEPVCSLAEPVSSVFLNFCPTDGIPPFVSELELIDDSTIEILFTEEVTPESAGDAGSYYIYNERTEGDTVSPATATLLSGNTAVELVFASPIEDREHYILRGVGISDPTGNIWEILERFGNGPDLIASDLIHVDTLSGCVSDSRITGIVKNIGQRSSSDCRAHLRYESLDADGNILETLGLYLFYVESLAPGETDTIDYGNISTYMQNRTLNSLGRFVMTVDKEEVIDEAEEDNNTLVSPITVLTPRDVRFWKGSDSQNYVQFDRALFDDPGLAEPVTRYEILCADDIENDYEIVAEIVADGSSVYIRTFLPSHTGEFSLLKVRAVRPAGEDTEYYGCCHWVVRTGENIPPAAPTGFTGLQSAETMYLSWDENTEYDIQGYVLTISETEEFPPDPDYPALPDGVFIEWGTSCSVPGCTPEYSPCYRLCAIDYGRNRSNFVYISPCHYTSDELFDTPVLPLTLYQNHPNPFNPSTTIKFHLPERCRVRLEVFDVAGRQLAVLIDESLDKGSHAAGWTGKDLNGSTAASGVYFYRLTAGKKTISKKMILLR